MKHLFRQIAAKVSAWTGSATTFLGAVLIVLVWGATGPLFDFSDTWQLVINTGTTIVTFLMVFLIQNTQNRDSKAVQLKLDELIHATKGARTHFVGLEDLSDEDLAQLDTEFKKLASNQNSARALVKLHEKIEAEHTRRISLAQASTAVLQKLHIVAPQVPTDQAGKPDKQS
ncbi:MAG: low affinity iron permease family protein [Candidatus Saccharimonadales bacterium]